MRVTLAEELWIVNGELMPPWIRAQSGTSCRGIVLPTPIVIERGESVEITWRGEPKFESYEETLNELLAEMGHEVPTREARPALDFGCNCGCKDCNTGWHCNDHRCFPLA